MLLFNVLYIVLSFYQLTYVHILNTESSWVFMVGFDIFELAQSAAIHNLSFLPVKLQLSFDLVLVGFFIHTAEG